jgi:hypothetical protein
MTLEKEWRELILRMQQSQPPGFPTDSSGKKVAQKNRPFNPEYSQAISRD